MPPATCFEFPQLKDEVTAILQDAVLSSLEGNAYNHSKVNDWINTMTTACINDLRQLCPNFKYVVTCFVKQRKGAGLEMNSCAFWDDKSDGICTVSWENATMSAILQCYGLAL